MKFDNEDTHYYKQAKEKDGKEAEEWPPKYAKFLLKCEKATVDGVEKEAVEAAFVDARRLARIRLVDCEADNIRNETPLKENGPDPVRDKAIVTAEWLKDLLGRKRVPVKALLLDQANLSGVGNWVADEVLYQAKIHPEQYSNTFSDSQIKDLHDSLIGVCTLAVETLADSKQFPETWLMKYRWDKGKKDSNVLPNGDRIVHLKVGGRTSAIVPSVQKKTGAVAGDIDGDEDGEKPANGRKRKAKPATGDEEDEAADDVDEKPPAKKGRGATKAKPTDGEVGGDARVAPSKKTGRVKRAGSTNGVKDEEEEVQANGGAEGEENGEPDAPAKAMKGKKATPKKMKAKFEKPVTPGERKSARTKAK